MSKILDNYIELVKKRKKLKEMYDKKDKELLEEKNSIERLLLSNEDIQIEVPEELYDDEPYLAWKLSDKTDGSAIKAYITIRDMLIPEKERQIKNDVDNLKASMAELENWALRELQERKASNFGVKGSGRAQLDTITRYNMADKSLFVKWAVENGAESELTVTVRPNSKFMSTIVEENGELPPGVSSFTEYKVKFVKG